MTQVFHLPDLGEGLTDAQIVEWRVAVGDVVVVDEVVAVVETAKAAVDLPCPFAGRVERLHGEVGDTIDVGAPFVSVAVEATPDVPSALTQGSGGASGPTGPGEADASDGSHASSGGDASTGLDPAQSAGAQTYREEERAGSGNVLIGYGTGEGSARRRSRVGRRGRRDRAASSAPAVTEPVLTTAFGERGGEQLLPPVPDAPGAVGVGAGGRAIRVISPLVRRLAAERGLDLAAIEPTGPRGIITRRDVEAALAAHPPGEAGRGDTANDTSTATGPSGQTGPPGFALPSGRVGEAGTGTAGGLRIPLTGVRGAIADKLTRSRREIPEATTWVDVDATGLLEIRDQLRATAPDAGIGVLPLLARIVVAALARHPELNASVDVERAQIVRHRGVNLSVAVQSPRGLMVPVVHGAHEMTARRLASALRDLTQTAREGRLTPAQLTGGTFTLNNFGVFGVDGSTPIINHPEAAMLGVGRILDRPWVVDGALQVRPVTQLSLTFDHRVCDGAEAGGFLRFVADCVERPGTLLAEL